MCNSNAYVIELSVYVNLWLDYAANTQPKVETFRSKVIGKDCFY